MTAQPIPRMSLGAEEVHLWVAFSDELQDAALLSAYEALMNPQERIQHRRFHFARHRHQYLVTRALIRTTLSRYAARAPESWTFVKNEYGRPEIADSEGIAPLRFNLSHTDGLVICGVTLERDIGVDVEDTLRRSSGMSIAQRFFSPDEVQTLQSTPEQDQQRRFFDFWTLKEAYIKARGLGLSLPLKQFSFHLTAGQPLRISMDPVLGDNPDAWQFALLRPTARHTAALAIRRDPTLQLRLVVYRVQPFSRVEAMPDIIAKTSYEACCAEQ